MRRGFCCNLFADRMGNHLPPSMVPHLPDHIMELTQRNSNLPRILNRDLPPVLQHACVSSSNAGSLIFLISGIPYTLDSYGQFAIPMYTVFFQMHQCILFPPGGTEQIITLIRAQNITIHVYLSDYLHSIEEMANMSMDEPIME
jgi:hypothetical protein